MTPNIPMLILMAFYLPVFIIRAIIIRWFGVSTGIRIIDDLFNPCNTPSHTDSQHGRTLGKNKPINNLLDGITDFSPYKGKRSNKKNTVEKELELTEQMISKLTSKSRNKVNIDIDTKNITVMTNNLSDELP